MTLLSNMKVFRERWWPYKLIALIEVFFLAGANCLMELNTVADFMSAPGVEYTHGVRASVFAIVAASALFITRLPKNQVSQDANIDLFSQMLSIVAALGAGVFWLLDETKGKTSLYVSTLLATMGVLAVGLVVTALFHSIRDWIRLRKERRAESVE